MAGHADWAEPTIKTLLNRLLKKGAVGADRDGRRYLYSPVLTRESWVASQSEGGFDRLFGGRVAPLAAPAALSACTDAGSAAGAAQVPAAAVAAGQGGRVVPKLLVRADGSVADVVVERPVPAPIGCGHSSACVASASRRTSSASWLT